MEADARGGREAKGKAEGKAEGQRKEPDLFRDTLVRYNGYANELGEALRPLMPRLLLPSYGVATAYVLADTAHKAHKAANSSSEESEAVEEERAKVAVAAVDTLLWQGLASVAIPGFCIRLVVTQTQNALASLAHVSLPATMRAWTPTTVGLACIPLIIKPIDRMVDLLMDETYRKYTSRHMATRYGKREEYG